MILQYAQIKWDARIIINKEINPKLIFFTFPTTLQTHTQKNEEEEE